MLSILGFVAIVVITIQVYKSARSTARNSAGWAAANLMVGLGIQFVFPFMAGVLFGTYLAATGRSTTFNATFFGLIGVIDIAGIILSIVGMWVIAKHVSAVRDDDENVPVPPPPPTFGIDRQ
jgi:hypothetical protein